MNAPNAGLSDGQRDVNRWVWLLAEVCARTGTPATREVLNLWARALIDVIHENNAVLTFMSDFERDVE